MERILIVPDCHHPYVDKQAWKVLLAAGARFKPHRIIVLGDFGDFYCTSQHRKDPTRTARLDLEVGASNKALDQLDALGAKHKHFIFGNHEDNLRRFLIDSAPQLYHMVNVEGLFRLKERGWTWTPYGSHYRCGKVFYAHDPAGCGAYAHYRASAKYGHSIVHGHTHRAAEAYFGNAVGEKRVAIQAGWLGDASKATYYHDIGKEHEWMHAFALGRMLPSGVTHIQLVPIIKGRACVRDRWVS